MTAYASIVTVGSELVEGLRVDTNTSYIARELGRVGFSVVESTSVGDDAERLAEVLRRLCAEMDLVVVTGGLGPTHDDITREGAALALGLPLAADPALFEGLRDVAARHKSSEAVEQIYVQAQVLDGARVIPALTGTAPGQIVSTQAGQLALLPGPPSEMAPMLAVLLQDFSGSRAAAIEFGVAAMAESEAQVRAQRAIGDISGITLTVLASPGDVKVILLDTGAGQGTLSQVAEAVGVELGAGCYTSRGESLAQVVVGACREAGVTVGFAESCTGGLVSAALTDVPGASDVFLGSVVSYADAVKRRVLDVSDDRLRTEGAVSEVTAREMAQGARVVLGCDWAVSVTGVAGPDGGSAEKPVGLVWFGICGPEGTAAVSRRFIGGDRTSIRSRARSTALDLLRRAVTGLEVK